jgi:hypothetical protein
VNEPRRARNVAGRTAAQQGGMAQFPCPTVCATCFWTRTRSSNRPCMLKLQMLVLRLPLGCIIRQSLCTLPEPTINNDGSKPASPGLGVHQPSSGVAESRELRCSGREADRKRNHDKHPPKKKTCNDSMVGLKWLVASTASLLLLVAAPVEGMSSAPDNVSSRLMIHVRNAAAAKRTAG